MYPNAPERDVGEKALNKRNLVKDECMEQAQDPGDHNEPPSPGGDPDQGPNDLPTPRAEQDKGTGKPKDKEGFGHIGNKDVPSSEGTPEPRQIF